MNGWLSAMYEVGLRIYDSIQDIQSISSSVTQGNSILSEIKAISLSSNGYLEDISKYQKGILEVLNRNVPYIRDNTARL